MGIKEKDLQTVESLQEGDKVRIVTSEGNSRNVDAGSIGGVGGDILYVSVNYEGEYPVLEASYNDIVDAVDNGQLPVLVDSRASMRMLFYLAVAAQEAGTYTVLFIAPYDPTDPAQFVANSADAQMTALDNN